MSKGTTQAEHCLNQLIEVSEFKTIRYLGRRPCINTLKKWIRNGILPGEIIGNCYFVNLTAVQNNRYDPIIDELMAN